MRRLWMLLCLNGWLLAGTACSDFTSEPYSTNSEPAALMRLVRPGWDPVGRDSLVHRKMTTGDGEPAETETLGIYPVLVAPLAPNRMLMIVAARPAADDGTPQTQHDTPARLDAHWFGKRGNRWYHVAEQYDFGSAGFDGMPGKIGTSMLDKRRRALVVESRSCQESRCNDWLQLFMVDRYQINPLLRDAPLHLAAATEAPNERCKALLRLKTGSRRRIALEEFSLRSGCYAIAGRWYLNAGTEDEPASLNLNFEGRRVTVRRVTAETEATPGPDEEEADKQPTPQEEYLATVNGISAQQRFVLTDGILVRNSGRNPLPTP